MEQVTRKMISQQAKQPSAGIEKNSMVFYDDGDTSLPAQSSVNFDGTLQERSKKVDKLSLVNSPSRTSMINLTKTSNLNKSLVQKTFEERIEYFKDKRKKNCDIVAMEHLAESQIECTFAPKICTNQKNRTIEQFIKDQQDFLKRKLKKQKIFKEQEVVRETKEMQPGPIINKNASSSRTQSRFKDKLVHNHDKILDKENNKEKSPNYNFKTNQYLKKQLDKKINEIFSKQNTVIDSVDCLCILEI